MRVLLMAICAFAVLSASAAPQFVTPAMVKRNGLTDEQYQMLWRQGKSPKITQQVARDWIFRASRYENVTNWLEVCGRENDFAKLSDKLQKENLVLAATNKIMVAKEAVAKLAKKQAERERDAARAERDAAKAYEKQVKDIRKAAKKDGKNLKKLIKVIENLAKISEADEFRELCELILGMLAEEGGA